MIIVCNSCFRDPGFSPIPEITYKSIAFIKRETTPSSIEVKLGFKDGDGDLGLSTTDRLPPFNNETITITGNIEVQNNPNYYNINVIYLVKKTDNTFKPCEEEPDSCSLANQKQLELLQGRFGDLNPDRKARPISGVLTFEFKFFLRNSVRDTSYLRGKTIKLKLFIKDRKLNQSNTVETDTLRIK
ncbi:MAG: hypothetical protein ACKVOU_03855 [Cytophagales bacterium]